MLTHGGMGKSSGFFMSWLEFCASRTACWWPVKHTLDICLIIKERARWPGVKNVYVKTESKCLFLGHQCLCSVDDKTLPRCQVHTDSLCMCWGFFLSFLETLKGHPWLVLCSLSDKTSNCTENHVFGAIPQSYLRGCALGFIPQFGSKKLFSILITGSLLFLNIIKMKYLLTLLSLIHWSFPVASEALVLQNPVQMIY